MTKQLVILLSGKKQAGKSTAAKYIFSLIANGKIGNKEYSLNKKGFLLDSEGTVVSIDTPSLSTKMLYNQYGVKIYSFADPLKDFVCNSFGIDKSLLYGTDSDKNSKTHIMWDDLPPNIRIKYNKQKRGSNDFIPAFGPMTVREILQVFGTDICRAMDENCWARATYNQIKKENYPVAIVADARFPNEITMGTEFGANAIRFTRNLFPNDNHRSETALDDFPLGEYSLIIDNSNMSLDEKNQHMQQYLNNLLFDYQILAENK